jgi:3,4-dihydroxy 2-butanone 4-phosphate synthase/GTP cyclohydrolase II
MHDAILIGIGTVLADDPRLTVRLADGADPQPVILDSNLSTPLACFLVQAHPCHPWIFTAPDANRAKRNALEATGAQVTSVARSMQVGLDLPAVLSFLANRGIRRIMVEGGARVISSFLTQNLVDLAVITVAPLFVGGLPVLEPGALPLSSGYPRLIAPQIEAMGEDCVIFGEVNAA